MQWYFIGLNSEGLKNPLYCLPHQQPEFEGARFRFKSPKYKVHYSMYIL